MQTNAVCSHCHTPLPEGSANQTGKATTCPQCGATIPSAESPWWVTVPAPVEVPWWIVPTSAISTCAAPEKPGAAEPVRREAPIVAAPVGSRRWVAALACLAAGVLVCVGLLLHNAPEARNDETQLALSKTRSEVPALAAAKKAAAPELLARPQEEREAIRPVAQVKAAEPERIARPVAEAIEVAELSGKKAAELEPVRLPLQAVKMDEPAPPEGVKGLLWWLASARKDVRLKGAHYLGRFGTAAKSAVGTLDYTMRVDPDSAVANEAASALARIGKASAPYLAAALSNERATVRFRAAAALAVIGPEARAAVPELLKALRDDSRQVRASAARALGEIGGNPRAVIPALCQAFGDAAPEVRKQASQALVNLGTDAVPALREALKSHVGALRRDAAQVLGMIGSDAKAAAGDLALLLTDNDPQVRAAVAEALAKMGQDAQAAIPALLKAMRAEKRFQVQKQLFQALTLVGSRDLPGFLKAVREVDKEGRWATPYLLGQFGPQAEDAVKPLIQLLRDPDPGKRLASALALGKLGLLSDQSVPALLKAIDDPIPQVRIAAGLSLSNLAPGHERIAEIRIAEGAKLLDQFLVLQAEQQMRQMQQAGQLSLMELLRPFNRRAATDPLVQSQYDKLVGILILASPFNPYRKSNGQMAEFLQQVELQARGSVTKLPMEAAPALVRGVNQAAIFNLGYC